jgi:hypothetical protein
MFIESAISVAVIVGLPTVNLEDYSFNKLDYTTNYKHCQPQNNKNTLEYNYITTEEYISSQLEIILDKTSRE